MQLITGENFAENILEIGSWCFGNVVLVKNIEPKHLPPDS